MKEIIIQYLLFKLKDGKYKKIILKYDGCVWMREWAEDKSFFVWLRNQVLFIKLHSNGKFHGAREGPAGEEWPAQNKRALPLRGAIV